MALISCPKCGQQMSDKASECPHCGCSPTKENPAPGTRRKRRREQTGKPQKTSHAIAVCALLAVALACGIAWLCLRGEREKTVKITPEFCEAIKNYSMVSDFHDGLAAVKDARTKKWGFIDTKGKLVIPCEYDNAYEYDYEFDVAEENEYLFHYSEGLIGVVKKEGNDGDANYTFGFINKKGKVVIPITYGNIGNFSEGLAAVEDAATRKWGFIDKKGNVVIPCQYYDVGDFSCGVAAVLKSRDDKLDFIDKKGKIVESLSGKYEFCYCDFEEFDSGYSDYDIISYLSSYFPKNYPPLPVKFINNVCCVCKNYGSHLVIDKNGNEVDTLGVEDYTKFMKYGDIVWGRYSRSSYDIPETYGYKDADGNIVVPAKYGYLGRFSDGVAVATLASNYASYDDRMVIYGYVDKHGNETFSQEDYDKIEKRNREIENEHKAKEEKAEREYNTGPDWLQGTWHFVTGYGDHLYATFHNGTLKCNFFGSMVYNTFTYSNGTLYFTKNAPRLRIDDSRHVVMTMDGYTMTKIN